MTRKNKFLIKQLDKSCEFRNVELFRYWWNELMRKFECDGRVNCSSCEMACHRKTGLMGQMNRLLNSKYVNIITIKKIWEKIKCIIER
ncbi:MAG: hypothetical protein ACXQS8_06385 [Candidatus Helarchaeales archaeon]